MVCGSRCCNVVVVVVVVVVAVVVIGHFILKPSIIITRKSTYERNSIAYKMNRFI